MPGSCSPQRGRPSGAAPKAVPSWCSLQNELGQKWQNQAEGLPHTSQWCHGHTHFPARGGAGQWAGPARWTRMSVLTPEGPASAGGGRPAPADTSPGRLPAYLALSPATVQTPLSHHRASPLQVRRSPISAPRGSPPGARSPSPWRPPPQGPASEVEAGTHRRAACAGPGRPGGRPWRRPCGRTAPAGPRRRSGSTRPLTPSSLPRGAAAAGSSSWSSCPSLPTRALSKPGRESVAWSRDRRAPAESWRRKAGTQTGMAGDPTHSRPNHSFAGRRLNPERKTGMCPSRQPETPVGLWAKDTRAPAHEGSRGRAERRRVRGAAVPAAEAVGPPNPCPPRGVGWQPHWEAALAGVPESGAATPRGSPRSCRVTGPPGAWARPWP